MKITTMDQKTANAIGKDLNALMRKFAEDHGLEFKAKGGRFTPNSFTPKFEFLVSGGSVAQSNLNAELFDYKVRYGSEVMLQGRKFKVSEISNKGKVTIEENGKKYTATKPETLIPLDFVAPKIDAPLLVGDGKIVILVDEKAVVVDKIMRTDDTDAAVSYRHPAGHLCSASWRLLFIREALDLCGDKAFNKVCRMVGMPSEYDWSFIRDADSDTIGEAAEYLNGVVGLKMAAMGLSSVENFRKVAVKA